MLKVNILLLEDLNQELDLIEIKFNNSITSNKINDLIRQIRCKYKEVVTYYGHFSIIADNNKIIEFINEEYNSGFYRTEVLPINIYKKNDSLRRYIGEAISQQLRNNFEKLIVSSNIKEWYFKAIDYTIKGKYRNFDLFEGFRFKVVFLDNQIGLIVDPKSKFYTDKTLRDKYNENPNISFKYLEKLCPIKKCDQIFNPFALCKHGNPESFGIMEVDNFLIPDKPSNAKKNLIKYYEEEGCIRKHLVNKLLDEKPFLNHFFSLDREPYAYPLEFIKIIPSISDAGDQSREVTQQTVLKPQDRYNRFEKSRKYFDSLKESSFPICLGDPLNANSPHLTHAIFSKPYYEINYENYSDSTDQNPFSLLKNNRYKLPPQLIKLHVIVPSEIEGLKLLIEEFFRYMYEWYNCNIQIQDILVKSNFKEKLNSNNFYLILRDKDSSEVDTIGFLLNKQIKFHSISLSTITKKEFVKRENVYAPIYHKNFPPFFTVEDITGYDRIIGFTTQYQGSHTLGCFLTYEKSGVLEKGYFIKQNRPKNFNTILGNLFRENYRKNRTLVILNGKLNKELKVIIGELGIEYITVSDTSLIRLFRSSKDYISKVGVDEGSAIYLKEHWYVVPFNSTQGTQKSIKFSKVNIPDDKFQNVVGICFKLTKYHIGYSDNSIKLPFPIHFGQKTIKKLREIDEKLIEFDYPLYL